MPCYHPAYRHKYTYRSFWYNAPLRDILMTIIMLSDIQLPGDIHKGFCDNLPPNDYLSITKDLYYCPFHSF